MGPADVFPGPKRCWQRLSTGWRDPKLIGSDRITKFSRTCIAVLLCVSLATPVLSAAEFHGMVKFSGLAVPGVTVTVTLSGKTYIAITNPQGIYTFKELPDGAGTIQVEMQIGRVSCRE